VNRAEDGDDDVHECDFGELCEVRAPSERWATRWLISLVLESEKQYASEGMEQVHIHTSRCCISSASLWLQHLAVSVTVVDQGIFSLPAADDRLRPPQVLYRLSQQAAIYDENGMKTMPGQQVARSLSPALPIPPPTLSRTHTYTDPHLLPTQPLIPFRSVPSLFPRHFSRHRAVSEKFRRL
jgi:hypothetical protein